MILSDAEVVVNGDGGGSGKRCVWGQNGHLPKPVISDAPIWTIHRFNMRESTTMGIGRNKSLCIGLSSILS